jgi:2-amino-4-hydroxy-6-hydroxymethyldihydropteridine diphosphokinase
MSERRVRAYVGLGANVGDARATLTRAVCELDDLPGCRVRAVSRLYATDPVGVTDQPEFHNAVVALDVPAGSDPAVGALDLLARLKELERQSGRQTRARWGPRESDLDLLIFGRAQVSVERPPGAGVGDVGADPTGMTKLLVVPHPLAQQRLFVLAPLSDIARWLVPPGWHETVMTARLRREGVEGAAAVRVLGDWDPGTGSWAGD